MKTCESVLHNSSCVQTGLKTDVDEGLTWRQPAAHCQVTTLPRRKLSAPGQSQNPTNTVALKRASLPYQIYLHLLATSLSTASCNSERSASVTIPIFPAASSGLCSCHGVEECGDSLVSSLKQLQNPGVATLLFLTGSVEQLQLGRNLAPTFCKAHTEKLQVLLHCLEIQMFCSQVPPTLVILMSPVITRRCNQSDGVTMCLMRPAPLRIAMARLAVASNLISGLGLSIPSPSPFALTSTPCCCKTTPRSRNIETQPIPAAAA